MSGGTVQAKSCSIGLQSRCWSLRRSRDGVHAVHDSSPRMNIFLHVHKNVYMHGVMTIHISASLND